MDELIQALKAAGEPTRLRILLALEHTELTVSELCRILGQSQPRVSRHLKLLGDAGLLDRQAEGTSAYYRYARSEFATRFLSSLKPLTDRDHPAVRRDRQRLAKVRADRSELAARSEEKIVAEAELIRPRSVSQGLVEREMLRQIADLSVSRLLDLGTGTGRMLELFGPHIQSGLGIEVSREMLNLARTRLDANRLDHCAVRYGNAYDLDIATGEMNLAVFHHVLHFLDEPAAAIEQAARTIAANGRLLIVDFNTHRIDALRTEHGHRHLGFSDDEVSGWCKAAGMGSVRVTHLRPPGHSSPSTGSPSPGGAPTPVPNGERDDRLTVTIWLAVQRADAPSHHDLEVA